MPKIRYQRLNLSQEKRAIISQANEIIGTYTEKGLDLTLRQLYYVFVAQDLFPEDRKWRSAGGRWVRDANGTKNAEPNYKWLGDAIADGRLCGLLDWDAITDRTRFVRREPHWRDPADIVDSCARQFAIDKWDRQPQYIECWIEKDALIGVIEGVCKESDVPYFACRGYASISEIWRAGNGRFLSKLQNEKQCTILYLGDHDPSGIDMAHDIRKRVNMFAGGTDAITIERLALNMDQIQFYNPPPNPT
jgi:hypothetical protein